MNEVQAKAYAALAVRSLGQASAEIANGIGNGSGFYTLTHIRGAQAAVAEATRCLANAEAHLEGADRNLNATLPRE